MGAAMSESTKYWSEIFVTAFNEAWEAAGLDKPTVLMIALAATVVGVLLLILTADEHAARAEIMLRIAGGAVLIIVFLFVFVWKSVHAPVSRDIALRNIIAGLHRQAADKQHHLAVHEKLGELWTEGNDLLARDGMEVAVKKALWFSKVERYLMEIGELDEAVGFKTIPDFAGQINKLRKIWMRAAKRASG
jgi:hypothetical protein